jgi:ArsR family transcriptional regulator
VQQIFILRFGVIARQRLPLPIECVHEIKPMNTSKPNFPCVTEPKPDDVLSSFRACGPIFNALGDKYRQDIVLLLAQNERLNVTQIAERSALSRPAISHHLKVLLHAGLIKMERVSRENFYSLAMHDALLELRKLVEQAEWACTSKAAIPEA